MHQISCKAGLEGEASNVVLKRAKLEFECRVYFENDCSEHEKAHISRHQYRLGATCWRAALWRGTWVSWWMTG